MAHKGFRWWLLSGPSPGKRGEGSGDRWEACPVAGETLGWLIMGWTLFLPRLLLNTLTSS